MKTIKFILSAILVTFMLSCNNDDDNNPMTCSTQGLFYTLGSSAQITATDASLSADYFPNNTIVNNQPVPAIEISGSDSNGDFIVFVTEVVTLNASGTAELIIGSGPNEMINVICLASATTVGGTMRYGFSGTYNGQSISGEFCVTVDSVNP